MSEDGRRNPRPSGRTYPSARLLDAKCAALQDEGYSQREIAERLGISQQRVAQRIQRHRARRADT